MVVSALCGARMSVQVRTGVRQLSDPLNPYEQGRKVLPHKFIRDLEKDGQPTLLKMMLKDELVGPYLDSLTEKDRDARIEERDVHGDNALHNALGIIVSYGSFYSFTKRLQKNPKLLTMVYGVLGTVATISATLLQMKFPPQRGLACMAPPPRQNVFEDYALFASAAGAFLTAVLSAKNKGEVRESGEALPKEVVQMATIRENLRYLLDKCSVHALMQPNEEGLSPVELMAAVPDEKDGSPADCVIWFADALKRHTDKVSAEDLSRKLVRKGRDWVQVRDNHFVPQPQDDSRREVKDEAAAAAPEPPTAGKRLLLNIVRNYNCFDLDSEGSELLIKMGKAADAAERRVRLAEQALENQQERLRKRQLALDAEAVSHALKTFGGSRRRSPGTN